MAHDRGSAVVSTDMVHFVSSLLGFVEEVLVKATAIGVIAVIAHARGYRLIKVPQSERVQK